MNFSPQNILVINFGQLGDVVLSLPAWRVIRENFPDARITALVGKASAEIIEITGFVDEKIVVDRVRLRDSGKVWSIAQILKLASEIRRRNFDFIVDLHSLYETNLLGFFSGAKYRLYANRENRSLDFLGNFHSKPALEDKTKHLTEHYLSVLKPLGIKNAKPFVELCPRQTDLETIENLLQTNNIAEKKLVGLFPGAGHISRRWSLENFAQLAKLLSKDETLQPIVFLGPEEANLRAEVEEKFPAATLIIDHLSIPQFAAALSLMQVLISNDTGAVHIGAVVGISIVLILDKSAPQTYLPLTEKLSVIRSGTLAEITVEEVFQAAREILQNKEPRVNEISIYKSQTK